MTTIQYYLTNPFLFRQFATITGKGNDEKGNFVITDTTPAYSQGGGQEADNGLLVSNGAPLRFTDVRFFEGAMKHYIPDGWEDLNDGASIEIIVDENRRMKNSILHTAGHLVASVAFKNIPNVTPTKGHHFSDGSYVELRGEVHTNIDTLKIQLQSILNEEIKTEKTVSYEMATAEVLKLKCPFVLPGIHTDNPLRVVNIETFFPMGCGGTHVKKLNEIPLLTITKMKSSKGTIRISYSCFIQ